MAPKCDPAIYGADDNAFAERCANDALAAPNAEDIWGSAIDQSARSKGNVPDAEDEKASVQVSDHLKAGGGDTEKVMYHPDAIPPRHRPGPAKSESQEKYFKPVPLKRRG